MEQRAAAVSTSAHSSRTAGHLRAVPLDPDTTLVPATFLQSQLCGGLKKVLRAITEERHVTVILEDVAQPDAAIGSRALRVLELSFRGVSQTAIAIELGVAPSTVCAELSGALLSLGVGERISALPPFLPQLWHLAANSRLVRTLGEPSARRQLTVMLPRVDLTLHELLSPAEMKVCRLLLEGHSHAQIAAARQTSGRTVANQLAAVFSKFKVSGRLELVARLAQSAPSH